jgi:GrxB family glutaredoxin
MRALFLLCVCVWAALPQLALCLQVPRAVTKLAPRVELQPSLPTLYVYDHCPFCVRVRLALGLKNVKYNTYFLGNDDVATPTALVGKKIAPIFEWSAGGISPMPESLDIIAKVDGDARFGPTNLLKPMSGRKDLSAWQAKAKDVNSAAQRPRYMMSPTLAEFCTQDAREAFVKNHPVAGIEKPDWKGMAADKRWQLYADSYVLSLSQIDIISANLAELDALIHSDASCSEGGVGLDDVDLWSRLRSVTLIKGVVWPAKLRRYMDNLAALGDVPLLWGMQQ